MKRKWLYGIIGLTIAAGLSTGAYMLGKREAGKQESDLAGEYEALRLKAADAAVVRRVSKQMEDIAYQQKEVSDRQRKRAEQQSQIAQSMRGRAEQESRAAREAERHAREAAMEAEFERANALRHQQEAEIQRDEANYAKSVADTLMRITLGRALGNAAEEQYYAGNTELASRLAYTGWYLMKRYRGNTYQNEIFIPLNLCSDTEKRWYTEKNGAVTSLFITSGKGCIAVTDYGEVERIEPFSGTREIIFQDNKYDFRDACGDEESVYALSIHGPLLKIGSDFSVHPFQLPSGTYRRIDRFCNGKLTISTDYSIILMNSSSGKIEKNIPLTKKLSAWAEYLDGLLLFFSDGTAATLDRNFVMNPAPFSTESAVTAAFSESSSGLIFLGLDNGGISSLNTADNKLTSLFSGHNSRITSLSTIGCILTSTGYDKSLQFFDMSSSFNISPVSIDFSGWPLCSCIINDRFILTGTSDGMVRMIDYSTDSMSAELNRKGYGFLTEEEWIQYTGTSIPYPDFK